MVAKELAIKVVHAHLEPEYSKINLGLFIWTCETELSSLAFDIPLVYFIFPFFLSFILLFYGSRRGVENTICYFSSSLLIFVYILHSCGVKLMSPCSGLTDWGHVYLFGCGWVWLSPSVVSTFYAYLWDICLSIKLWDVYFF